MQNLKLFSSSWGVWFGLLILKNIQNCIIVIFHQMCLTNPSFQPASYSIGWKHLFHNWYKHLYSLFPRMLQRCMHVKGFTYAKNKFHHRQWILFPFICFNESPLKMMTNAFYFTLKLFVFEIFIFLSWSFGYVLKQLDKMAMISFKIYYITDWTKNNYNGHIIPNDSEVKTTRQWNLIS